MGGLKAERLSFSSIIRILFIRFLFWSILFFTSYPACVQTKGFSPDYHKPIQDASAPHLCGKAWWQAQFKQVKVKFQISKTCERPIIYQIARTTQSPGVP